MGSDAEVFIFDYQMYTSSVVPAMQTFIKTSNAEPWLAAIIRASDELMLPAYREQYVYKFQHGADFQAHCSYLDKNWAWRGQHQSAKAWFANWQQRACRSTSCVEINQCALHQQGHLADELTLLLNEVVEQRCLGSSIFVGRTVTVRFHQAWLLQQGIEVEHPVNQLLDCLGQRGWVIGYGWAGSAEGIHGWLNPQETARLAYHLSKFELPSIQPTLEAMQQALRTFWNQDLREEYFPNVAFEALGLAFIRNLALLARQEQQGLLWRNT
ncbi:hypothetical protein Haur_3227 [Herpetosiphon aurantiacus DSM 785]|uniref:Uncharacterized protein n=2 Tax=Herpetosiphon TaxID=64 RepID=A9B6Z6_HERA2|nr:hypothetical protein Haur_3227 [Herpetosiphon aurantiacus DSM 785]